MNIIDAIKSGKKFRRPVFPAGRWYEYAGKEVILTVTSPELTISTGHFSYLPDKIDILADDWEIEEEKVTISISKLDEAFVRVYKLGQELHNHRGSLCLEWFRNEFLKEEL